MSKSIVSKLSTDINVGMEEVVSVFVAQYEDNLFAKKKELSAEIKASKKDLTDLDKRVEAGVETDQYNIKKIDVIDMSSKVDEVDVNWEDPSYRNSKSFKPSIRVTIELEDIKSDVNGDRSSFHKAFDTPISKADIKTHTHLNETIESLNSELVEVMGLIKSVSRKERQVRGRISQKKLQESGFSGLMEDKEMLSLIQL